MEKIITTILLSIATQYCSAQADISFDIGGTKQSEYFSTIPYENDNGMLIVTASINGKQYRFILDTGAPTVISPSLYNDLKPTILSTISINDANELIDSVEVVSLKEITIGDITFTDIPAIVVKQTFIMDCFQADGFIGSNLLRNSIIQFSDTSRTIIITNDEKKLTLSPKHSSKLFLIYDGMPYVGIKLKSKRTANELLLFDTGMTGFYDVSLSQLNMDKLHIFEIMGVSTGSNSIGAHGVGRDTLEYRMLLPLMEINNAKFKNITVRTTIADDSRVGNKLLEYGKVTVDYKNERFYFEPFFDEEKDLSEKNFPIDFIPRDNHLYIGFVWDASLEDKIKVGDQVIAINDVNYENISLCDLIEKKSEIRAQERMILTTRNESGTIIETILEKN